MPSAFGLDLSGFSTGTSALARADRTSETITVTQYSNHCFTEKIKGCGELPAILVSEQRIVAACMSKCSLVVDTPIDLQTLLKPDPCSYTWQLVQRPVDYAFAARPPLADRIGAPVARFMAVASPLQRSGIASLGRNLFESYPAASLALMGLPRAGYKGCAEYTKRHEWLPVVSGKPKQRAKNELLAATLSTLGWLAAPGDMLTHDAFDAALCAIAGVASQNSLLRDPQLTTTIRERLATMMPGCVTADNLVAPAGYILLREKPIRVEVYCKEIKSDEELLNAIASTHNEEYRFRP